MLLWFCEKLFRKQRLIAFLVSDRMTCRGFWLAMRLLLGEKGMMRALLGKLAAG